ncbi:FAD-dependent oxidoreductase [Microlunatus ginsengisoli]|uniref:FAD-dependent monooxygenase n=1 Tax=Microlunatus ginsengisoli TaxID=363863 RepID=A0ABP7AWI8_9ACTN
MPDNDTNRPLPSTRPTGRPDARVRSAIVIGGGIAGPVTAAALTRAGIEAAVYEAYPEPSGGIGGSLALAPNGVAALEIVGAADAVRERALPITASSVSIADRPLGATPSLPDLEPLRMIGRGPLHEALRTAARQAGVPLHHGRRLVGVEEAPDGVTARFADGSTATADVLIGADGARSTVRRLIDPQAPAADYTGMLGFEGFVPHDALPARLDVGTPGEMVFAFGRRAYYLYWPTPDGVGWGVNLPSETYLSYADARRTPAEEWLRIIRERYAGDRPGAALAAGTVPETLQVVGALHIMPPVPHWSRGRLVLVGDAVHAPSNSTGQGASLAIESSIELARCLRDLPDAGSAFAAYERLRRNRVETIARRGAKLNHAKTPGPIARALMRLILPAMLNRTSTLDVLGREQRFRIDWDEPARPEDLSGSQRAIAR